MEMPQGVLSQQVKKTPRLPQPFNEPICISHGRSQVFAEACFSFRLFKTWSRELCSMPIVSKVSPKYEKHRLRLAICAWNARWQFSREVTLLQYTTDIAYEIHRVNRCTTTTLPKCLELFLHVIMLRQQDSLSVGGTWGPLK